MSLLIESIKFSNGKYYNLFYHEQRMNLALKTLCGVEGHFNLEEFLQSMPIPEQGFYKCRIVYDDVSREVEYLPYIAKPVRSLQIVHHDRIRYAYKYADRSTIDSLFALRKDCDDVLIVRRGLVTDTSYANIVLKRNGAWYTPWSALLKGTMRAYLLERNLISEEEIRMEEINTFESFKLINALLEFDAPEIDVSHIVF